MSPARVVLSSNRSLGPSPLRVWMASMTSRLLPTLWPRGSSMLLITAVMRRPAFWPIPIMISASSTASSFVFIKAPLPYLTSSTMFLHPAASFLLIMEEAMSGLLMTVAVSSRRAYSFPSAGVK